MTTLTVRRLLIDLEPPVPRHWCDGDAFLTAFFNALSMSFPAGEQFFIDAVRDGLKVLPQPQQAAFSAEAKGFIGQEATHRRIHGLFNAHLERQGLRNGWDARIRARLPLFAGQDARHPLAVTAANEHFTALLAEWVLSHPDLLQRTEPRLQTLWQWHCAEEAEHKSTAFDVYQALGGNQHWRVLWFKRITLVFLGDLARQTLANLRHDGTLWRWSTWRSAARTLLGRHGLLRTSLAPWRAYLHADFHPRQQHSDLSQRWLEQHRNAYTPVHSAASAAPSSAAAA